MPDDSLPPDEPHKPKFEVLRGGVGAGQGSHNRSGRKHADDYWEQILRAISRIERRSGNLPTLKQISSESGFSVEMIETVIRKFQPEQAAEFSSYLTKILHTAEKSENASNVIAPEEWE